MELNTYVHIVYYIGEVHFFLNFIFYYSYIYTQIINKICHFDIKFETKHR